MSGTAPLITVGLPVYNGMPYLPESLDSLLAQTYSDFEILAVNDGSTDNSLEYLRSVRDPRLRVVSQENQGLTATLNRMLREVRSPWLVRHDADDVAYPNRFARLVVQIQKQPEAGMFYSLANYYPRGSVGQFRETRGTPADIRALVLSGYLPSICHPTVALNVEKALSLGGYRFNLHVEDTDLWWRMALKYDIQFVPEVLVGFRQNHMSVSSKNLTDQAAHTAYVQYLLLSHLQGLQPLPVEDVRSVLLRIRNVKKLRFKARIRACNMELGRGNRRKAFYEAVSAFAASPRAFLQRLRDEFTGQRTIATGENPALFLSHKDTLWPRKQTSAMREFQPLAQ
jgi:hypothetical protein